MNQAHTSEDAALAGRREPAQYPARHVLLGVLGAAFAMFGVVVSPLAAVPVVERKYVVLGFVCLGIGVAMLVLSFWLARRARRAAASRSS